MESSTPNSSSDPTAANSTPSVGSSTSNPNSSSDPTSANSAPNLGSSNGHRIEQSSGPAVPATIPEASATVPAAAAATAAAAAAQPPPPPPPPPPNSSNSTAPATAQRINAANGTTSGALGETGHRDGQTQAAEDDQCKNEADFLPILQWLQFKACKEVARAIAGPRDLFRVHLEDQLWLCLKQALLLPRDAKNLKEAVSMLPHWPPTTILLEPRIYREEPFTIDKPVTIIGTYQPSRFSTSTSASERAATATTTTTPTTTPLPAAAAAAATTTPTIETSLQQQEANESSSRARLSTVAKPADLLKAELHFGNVGERSDPATRGLFAISIGAEMSKSADDSDTDIDGVGGERGARGCWPHLRGLSLLCHLPGVKVVGGEPKLVDVEIRTSLGSAIQVISKASPTLLRCRFDGSTEHYGSRSVACVFHERARGLLAECSFTSCYGPGLAFQDRARPIVKNCLFQGCFGIACLVRGSSRPRLESCRFEANRSSGIFMTQTSAASLFDLYLTGHTMPAIMAGENASGDIRSSQLEGNLGIGLLLVGGSSPLIEGNRICNNRKNVGTASAKTRAKEQIDAHRHRRQFEPDQSQVKGAKRSAVAVQDRASPILRDNTISDNDGYGISASGTSNPTIERNVIRNHKNPAVSFRDAAGGLLRGNRIENNAGYGLAAVADSQPVVEGNHFASNQTSIWLGGSSSTRLLNNVCTDDASSNVMVGDSAAIFAEGNSFSAQSASAVVLSKTCRGHLQRNRFFESNSPCILLSKKADLEIDSSNTLGDQILRRTRCTVAGFDALIPEDVYLREKRASQLASSIDSSEPKLMKLEHRQQGGEAVGEAGGEQEQQQQQEPENQAKRRRLDPSEVQSWT